MNVAKNVSYKIYKTDKNLDTDIDNVSGGTSFIGYGIEIGAVIGNFYKVGNVSSQYFLNANDGSIIIPSILICANALQANAMFENLKKDKMRFNKLATEIQKQKIINNAKLTQMMNEKYTISSESNALSNNLERSKRLSLNNGIFKPNDNY